jgi:hypothetical protein
VEHNKDNIDIIDYVGNNNEYIFKNVLIKDISAAKSEIMIIDDKNSRCCYTANKFSYIFPSEDVVNCLKFQENKYKYYLYYFNKEIYLCDYTSYMDEFSLLINSILKFPPCRTHEISKLISIYFAPIKLRLLKR